MTPSHASAIFAIDTFSCVSTIVSHPAVTCAIPATARPEHLKDNLGAGRGTMPDAAARRRMQEHFQTL